jgi:hypothetical protein
MLITTGAILLTPAILAVPTHALPVSPAPVFADSVSDACAGIGLAGGSCTNNGNRISDVIKAIINILSAFVGVAAIIMIIISGFRYVTSGGDPNNVSSAKKTLIYAIIGLIIVALAQVIVHFVLSKTG